MPPECSCPRAGRGGLCAGAEGVGTVNGTEWATGRRIVLDAMGGDHAPAAPVAGAVAAAREYGLAVDLTGPADVLHAELARHRASNLPITVVHAPEVVGMAEAPAVAVRQKRESSLVVGMRRVAQRQADAFVSAGNSGAVMAAALLGLQRIPGVARPALGAVMPTARGHCLLLDVGANADCKPEHLAQFAVMGADYAERVMGIARPSVALLSIGEEPSKGNQLTRDAHPLLQELPLRFIGNVEGKDIPLGNADVIVTDGFTGNVVLKFGEGTPRALARIVRAELLPHAPERIALPVLGLGALAAAAVPPLRRPAAHVAGAALLGGVVVALGFAPAVSRLWRRLDWAEQGGVPLLGVNGVCIIAHGRSNAKAIKNALRVAGEAAAGGLVQHIAAGVRARREAPRPLHEIGV
jgi:phosphate acyltransferase